ncbi:MAG TPA: DUF547 domain-containing protein [Vicinamibacterales bacterium]|nr:DUF547 domain-containing protein [Vicinamibacterales bacterium]
MAGGVIAAAILVAAPRPAGLESRQADRHVVFDRILDTYVREGRVYYRALKAERGPLDRYIASLDVPPADVASWSPAEQQAFWLNAYNAIVLRTVIDAYPIATRTQQYPERSIRQIPGAFERVTHRVAGRAMTLDGIEEHLLASFGDARLSLALGRGALGSPRLRSEAFSAARLDAQLGEVVKECATRLVCSEVDLAEERLVISPIVGWREEAFVRSFEAQAAGRWTSRSPIERAAAAMVYPHVFSREQAMLERDTFRMVYREFDWRLNE